MTPAHSLVERTRVETTRVETTRTEQDRETLATLRQIGFPVYTPTGDVSPVRLPAI